MKIEYFRASKFWQRGHVAEEFRQQMAAKGVTAEVHHIREARPISSYLRPAHIQLTRALFRGVAEEQEHATRRRLAYCLPVTSQTPHPVTGLLRTLALPLACESGSGARDLRADPRLRAGGGAGSARSAGGGRRVCRPHGPERERQDDRRRVDLRTPRAHRRGGGGLWFLHPPGTRRGERPRAPGVRARHPRALRRHDGQRPPAPRSGGRTVLRETIWRSAATSCS